MKAHFASSDDPLKEGETLTALCGASVPNAEFLITWSKSFRWGEKIRDLIREEFWSSIGNCKKCLIAELTGRYVYGIRTRVGGEKEEEAA
jgi:hypothetical protein